jgi:hypothetical protein
MLTVSGAPPRATQRGGWSLAKIATIACLVLGGMPLIVYPGVIVADVMALAASGGHLRLPASLPEWLNGYVIIGATIYPAIWVPALVRSILLIRRASEASALRISLIPLAFLVTLPLAFALSGAMNG